LKGLKFIKNKLKKYLNKEVLLLDPQSKKTKYFEVKELMNIFSGGNKYMSIWLSEEQRELTADIINKSLMVNMKDPLEDTLKHILCLKKT